MRTSLVTPPGRHTTELSTQGNEYVIHDYLGSFQDPDARPQAFLVEVTNPNGTIRPHYHEVDQYQVVVGGSGVIAPHDVLTPGIIHYTDSYTPYGPIHAGEDGIRFFTLRATGTVGSNYMPDSAGRQPVKPGFTFECLADVALPVADSGLRLLHESPDGAQAFELRAAPGDHLPVPGDDALAREGYYIVLAGDLDVDGRSAPADTCEYHEPGAPAVAWRAGGDGAVVALVTFADQDVPRTRERRRTRS